MKEIGDHLIPKIQLAQRFITEQHVMNDALNRLIRDSSATESILAIDRSREFLRILYADLSASYSTKQEEELYSVAGGQLGRYSEAVDRYVRLLEEGNIGAANRELPEEIDNLRVRLLMTLADISAYHEETMKENVRETAQQHRLALAVVWGGIVVLLLLCAVTGIGVVRSTLKNIRYVAEVMNRVEENDAVMLPRMNVKTVDELKSIAAAYNRMAETLENKARKEVDYSKALQDQNWIKTNVASIMKSLQGSRTLDTFGERLLSRIVPLSGAGAGALYLAKEDGQENNRFECIAAYAGGQPRDVQRSFALGEGLVGQCAADGIAVYRKAPGDYMKIISGLGESAATHLLLIPVFFEDKAVAVLELASFAEFEPRTRKLLEELTTGTIGVSMRDISNHLRIQELLKESRTYIEELQSQSEELQQQQEELRSLNDKLAEQYRYAEKRKTELELIQAELKAKAEDLQAGSRFKSEFLANMSHELRTPLNSLLILAQMLADDKEGNLTEKQKEYAQTILFSGNELLALISDILDLSKIEAGKMELAEERFLPQTFATEIKRQFEEIAFNRGLEFQVQVEEQLSSKEFITDYGRLLQIINNLLSNAFKFTPRGKVSLCLSEDLPSAERNPLPKGMTMLVFAVSDTGIGIAREKHQFIFEPFRQADGRMNRRYGGTGLGLAICKELVEMMDGTIHLESEEGLGSTFTVKLPMMRLDASSIAEAAATLDPETGGDRESVVENGGEAVGLPNRRNGKILIVDDDIRYVYALSAALADRQYEVIFVEEGNSALKKLEEHSDIDLALMDMMMPGMDGYETIRAIRANTALKDLPIIAVTAKAMKQDRELCLEAGANDYLSKPIKLDKLLSLFEVWIHGRSTG